MKKLLGMIAFILLCSGAAHAQANCLPQFFNDFEGGTSGSTVTTTQLQNTSYSVGGTWTLNGTMTWNTAASMPLPNPTGVLCGSSTSYPTTAQSLGIVETGTGVSVANNVQFLWTGNSTTTLSDSVWFCSDLAATDSTDIDTFLIASAGTDYINWTFEGNGTSRNFQLESSGGSSGTHITYPGVGGAGSCNTPSNWVILNLKYVNSASCGGAATHSGAIYNYQGILIGSTLTEPCAGANNPNHVVIGHIGSQTMTSGGHNYWDSFQGNFSGTFPIAHTCDAATTSSTDTQTALNNCSTGGYVVLPSGSSTWSSQVTVAPTGSLTLEGATVCTGGCNAGSGGTSLAFTDNTNITLDTTSSGGTLNVTGLSNAAFLTLQNITFINGAAASNGQVQINGTHDEVTFRMNHVHFKDNISSEGVCTYVFTTSGLIDHYLVDSTNGTTSCTPVNTRGDFASSGYQDWNDATNFGSSNGVIIEDSVENVTTPTTEGYFDCYSGGKITFRYSIINGGEVGGCHGTDSGAIRSAVTMEVYNDAINSCPFSGTFGIMNTRGGTLLFHDNTVTGTCTSIDLQYLRISEQDQTHAGTWGFAIQGLNWTPVSAVPTNPNSDFNTLNAPDWTASHSYTCSSSSPCAIAPLLHNTGQSGGNGGYNYISTANCTSGSTEPNPWNQTPGGTNTTDGTCSWENVAGVQAASSGGDGFTSNSVADTLSTTGTRYFDANGGVYPFRDQPGTIHNQVVYGNYQWNNSGAGLPSPVFTTDSATSTVIVSGRDYFNGSSPSGYTPYTYPDPLQGGGGTATVPSCTPTSGVVPQTVTCTNPNSGTTVMCYAASPTTPATNGAGTGCTTGTQYTTALSIASAETLEVIAGTSTLTDSSVVSYTYTAASVTGSSNSSGVRYGGGVITTN